MKNIEKGTEEYLAKAEMALTTKDSKILTNILREEKNDIISSRAARNYNCTPEILVEVLKRGKDDDVSHWVASNPNTPPEMLAEVLKRGKHDWVSCYTSQNPNCPPEAIINWMYSIGKIEKEDPKKHIIEYEIIKQDDLSDLKDLL